MDHPRSLYCLFLSFETKITIITKNACEKCPSSIQCWDLKPQPSGDGSPPITTRPGLPPTTNFRIVDQKSVLIVRSS